MRSKGRLSLASDVQSVARLHGGRPRQSEALAATVVAVPVCEAETRGLSTLTALTNEGADVAKRTRGTSPEDRSPRSFCVSGVKITPPTQSGTVPSTCSLT
jgi:hypothetical protein